MDLHVPEGPVRSVKDFLLHIFIVTIGILIAIGLEQLVEAHHRAVRVREAVEGFEKELTYNKSQIDELMGATIDLREQIKAALAGLDDATTRSIEYPGISYDPMSNASWDAAVATQALSELPFERVHAYAYAFDMLRVFDAVEREGMADWEAVRAFGNDPRTLTPDERRSLIERLRRYENFTYTLELVGKGAKSACDRALKKEEAVHA